MSSSTFSLFLLWLTVVLYLGERGEALSSCPTHANFICYCNDHDDVDKVKTVKMCRRLTKFKGHECFPCSSFRKDLWNCSTCPQNTCLKCSMHKIGEEESPGIYVEPSANKSMRIFKFRIIEDQFDKKWYGNTTIPESENNSRDFIETNADDAAAKETSTDTSTTPYNTPEKLLIIYRYDEDRSLEQLHSSVTHIEAANDLKIIKDVEKSTDNIEMHDLREASQASPAAGQIENAEYEITAYPLSNTDMEINWDLKQEIPYNDWCEIKKLERKGNLYCKTSSDEKECELKCHEGFAFDGERNITARCSKREGGIWLPDINALCDAVPKSPNETQSFTRSKREILARDPQRQWCGIPLGIKHGDWDCTVYPNKKKCELTCHEGYGWGRGNKKEFTCLRRKNRWGPTFIRPCTRRGRKPNLGKYPGPNCRGTGTWRRPCGNPCYKPRCKPGRIPGYMRDLDLGGKPGCKPGRMFKNNRCSKFSCKPGSKFWACLVSPLRPPDDAYRPKTTPAPTTPPKDDVIIVSLTPEPYYKG